MPLYEYECKQCHRLTEKIQKFSDPPLAACPHCGGPLEQLIHAPAISFKGGGWYADGYGNAKPSSSKSESGSSDGSAAGSAGSGGSTKSEGAATSGASAPAAAPSDKK